MGVASWTDEPRYHFIALGMAVMLCAGALFAWLEADLVAYWLHGRVWAREKVRVE